MNSYIFYFIYFTGSNTNTKLPIPGYQYLPANTGRFQGQLSTNQIPTHQFGPLNQKACPTRRGTRLANI